MTLYQELLTELIPLVDKKLGQQADEAGKLDTSNLCTYDVWRQRDRAATERLKEFFSQRYDARFTQHGDAYAIHMAGIRSSSTSGWLGAIRNWKRSAEAKIRRAA